MEPLLKNKIHKISLWLKISFCKEKWNCESLMFIYDTTLEELWSFDIFLEKVTQLEYFSTLTNYSPSSLNELGIEWINDQDSF